MRLAFTLALIATLGRGAAETTEDFFDDRLLHEVRLTLHPSDWQRLRDNYQENTYYPCTFQWRGLVVENVGIRSKGFGTRNPVKPGLRVDFNRFEEGQEFLGLKSCFLDNFGQDASMLKERLTMLLFRRMGLPASREAHTRLYINGQYAGVYVIGESIDKRYLQRQFGEDDGYLYKYEWDGPYHFEYRGPDASRYSPLPFEPHTHEKDPQPLPLVAMIRTMNEAPEAGFPQAMAEYLDLKRFVTHLALENFVSESDGILGDLYGMANYYLYQFERSNRFQFLVWDKDATFTSSARNIFQNVNDNVLTRRVLAVPEWRRAYLEALATSAVLAGGEGGWLEQEIVREYNQIRAAAREDPVKQCPSPAGVLRTCSNEEFENEVVRIRQFARERAGFVLREVTATGFQPSGGTVNAAVTISGALAPGALATVYGERLAVATAQADSLPLPLALAGASLVINGFPAPLLYASPTQVNFQVPWEIVPGQAPVTAIVGGAIGNTATAVIERVSPGIFAAVHADGSLISADRPARAGEVIVIYANGLGPVTAAATTLEMPEVTVGGLPAEVLYSGLAPGFVGLYQLNIRLPAGLTPGAATPLVLRLGERTAPPAPIATL